MLDKDRFELFQKYRHIIYPLILGIFFILIFINNINWLALDKSIPSSDSSMHLNIGYHYFYALKSGNLVYFFLNAHEHYPNLVHQVTAFFYLVFGFKDDIAVISHFPFWLILIFSTYFTGKKFFGNEAGLLAGIASFSSPFIVITSQHYLLDVPCAAMTALSIMCLVYCEKFSNQKWTIAFFISFALAMLVKWSSIFYIIIPFLLCFINFIRKSYKNKKDFIFIVTFLLIIGALFLTALVYNFKNIPRILTMGGNPLFLYCIETAVWFSLLLVVSLFNFEKKHHKRFLQGSILFIIITWHFYGLNVINLVDYVKIQSNAAVSRGDIFSPFILTWINSIKSFTIPGILLIFTGLLWLIFRKKKEFGHYLILSGFAGSLLILLIIPIKDPRYLLPLIVYTAIFQTFWIFKISFKPLKIILILLLVFLWSMGIAGWRMPFYKELSNNPPLFHHIGNLFAVPPNRDNWKVGEIEEIIHKHTRGKNTIILTFFEFTRDIKCSPRDIISRYNKLESGFITWPDTLGKKPAYRYRTGSPEDSYPYQFALTPPQPNDKNPEYNNLLILYLSDNDIKSWETTYLDYFLLERNLCGNLKLKEKLTLPGGITLFILKTKIDPAVEPDGL